MTNQAAIEFFVANAGYSYDPKTESPEEGSYRCAAQLADAEARAERAGFVFEWEQDDIDSSAFDDESELRPLWVCIARDKTGAVVGSLGGVDFGPDADPWGDDYARVVQAEISLEALADDAITEALSWLEKAAQMAEQ